MKKAQGYSTIELVMVIVIIGIVSVFTYVKYPSTTPFNLNSIAEQLKADIRLAQTQAMSITNATYSITIASGSYTVTGYSTVTLPSGVTLSPAQTITFDQSGVPTAGTTVTVTVSGSTRVLTINGVTGYVSG
jgi:prepilin-type N-terminal cleavage/methylation domain-containing protein